MRRLFALFASVILGLGLTLASTSPASADSTSLGCRISPGTTFAWTSFCTNSTTASWYNAGFLVQDAPTPLSYTWNIPAGYSVYADCGSSDNSCGVVTHAGDYLTVSVTLDYGDHTESYSATADIEACPRC